MNEHDKNRVRGRAAVRWLIAAAFIAGVALSGLFAGMANRAGLFFLFLGTAASVLTDFSRSEIREAFRLAAGKSGTPEARREAASFWEAAARNAWALGVMGSLLNFTVVLGGGSGGIADISDRMIQSFIVTFYGLVLAVLLLVPAMKISGLAGNGEPGPGPRPSRGGPFLFERVTGYVLFAVVLGLTVLSLVRSVPPGGPLSAAEVMLHGPAALFIFGGSIALALFLGTGRGAWTFGFGMTGLAALFLGLIQTMFGFVHTDIKEISAAIAFIISSSLYALLGLVLVAAPLEDRKRPDGGDQPGRLSRVLWMAFPFVAFIFLVLSWILVITPMKRTG